MNDFYARCVPDDEKQRMCGLEPFDEFEEWHLKCTHYVLLIGTKGTCNSLFDSIFSNSLVNGSEVSERSVVAFNKQHLTNGRCNNSDEALQRFGHAMCQVSNDYLSYAADQAAVTDGAVEPHHFVLTGGFGVSGGKHQRVNTVTVFNTATNLTMPVLLTSPAVEDSSSSSRQEFNLARMHHTATFIDGAGVLLLGGRLSPCKPLLTPCLLTVHCSDRIQTNQLAAGCHDDTRLCYTATARLLDTTGVVPTARWRHAAVSCCTDGGKLDG
jgi:tRNA wybutosine-synthesizing protein 4